MLQGVALIAMISGCSVVLGTPATAGWPSSDPDDYAYQQGYNCYVYDKTLAIDLVVAITGTAIALAGSILESKPVAVGAGAITAPFVYSGLAGALGRSRCGRWAREIPLMPHGPTPTEGSGAPNEPDRAP